MPIIQWLAMRLRGTDPKAVRSAVAKAEAAGLSLSALEIESHLLAGGDIDAVIGAMTEARRAGLPDNFAAVAEAELAKVNLRDFVAAKYQDREQRTLSGLRTAARANPDAALRLAAQLLATLDQIDAARVKGPRGLTERLSWDVIDGAYADRRTKVLAELQELGPSLPGTVGDAIRSRLARAI